MKFSRMIAGTVFSVMLSGCAALRCAALQCSTTTVRRLISSLMAGMGSIAFMRPPLKRVASMVKREPLIFIAQI